MKGKRRGFKFRVRSLTIKVHRNFFLFARLNLPNEPISRAKKVFDSNFPSPCFDVPEASNFTSGVVQNRETKNRRLETIVTSDTFLFSYKQRTIVPFLSELVSSQQEND